MNTTIHIDYKELRKVNPQAARLAVLEYLKANGNNKANAARVFKINRPVAYDIVRKQQQQNLCDRSRAPKTQPTKTAAEIEDRVIEIKSKTRLGPKRLSLYLEKYYQVKVAPGTIRHIVRRNRHRITYLTKLPKRRKEKREFIDWYSAKPFEIVQIDLKFIRDLKALSREQIVHLDKHHVPNYQWSALDVNSRFKLMAYSREKSWTNGLCFYLWVIAWFRSHGIEAKIVFTVDNGEEFGGSSWFKVKELKKLIRGFGCRLIQNRKGHCEENAHVERSHRTDDDEFYKLRAFSFTDEATLCDEALQYLYYYNTLREHSSLEYKTPFDYLRSQLPNLNQQIKYVRPFMLDQVAVKLGPWSGYNVLAQHREM